MASQSPPPPPLLMSSSGEQIDPSPPPPPPVSSSSSDSHKLLPTPFLTKTYQLVDDVSLDAVVSWNEDGTAFVVWNPAEFARDVLPKHFKHNNFSSFVRQLNTYGFRKIIPDRWEFSNDCFRRGDKRLLCDIVRRKLAASAAAVQGGSALSVASLALPIAVPVTPSTSSCGEGQVRQVNSSWNSNSMPVFVAPSSAALLFIDQSECHQGSSSRAHLMDENDKLKKKNTQLYKELRQMKSMCTNIYSMMSNYNPGSGLVPGLGHGPGPPPLHLPMLGAVSVGCVSHNSSQAESMMIPLQLISAGQRLLGTVADETPAVEIEPAATVAADEHLSSNPSLFGYQLGSKRAREGDSSGEPVKQDDLLQLQQPG